MKYFECNCFYINNKNIEKDIDNNKKSNFSNDFSKIEYDKTINNVYQLKQKLLGKRVKTIK